MKIYQKTGWTNFDELQVTDFTLNEGTNSLVMSESMCKGWFVNKYHKTCNGWYLRRNNEASLLHCWYINSTYIHSKNVLGL